MKITFQFDNGTSRIYLTPENARDEQYLSLCVGGKTDVKVGPSKDKQLMLEFSPQAKFVVVPPLEELRANWHEEIAKSKAENC